MQARGKCQLSWMLLMLLMGLTLGCAGDNPGTWTAEKVSAHLADRLEITDVKLSATENGFSGTGLRADGETLDLKITQDPEKLEMRWDVKGDRGFVEEGSYGFVTP